MNSRGRLFSPLGCLSVLILSISIVAIVLFSGGRMFSPGPLTAQASGLTQLNGFASHADFEADCNQCHVPLQGTSAEKCEACHVNTATELADQAGLHGRLPAGQATRCADCHADHQGRDFAPSEAALKAFDHTSSGFSLARHIVDYEQAPLACQECHAQGAYTFQLPQCLHCHAAHDAAFTVAHGRAFGPNCLDCHDGQDKMHGFDHSNTRFALDGQHASAACTTCHSPQQPADETPTECAGCHAESASHAGVFGTDCAACHTTAAWSPARLGEQAEFQHALTGFQLAHHVSNFDGTPMACGACHAGNQFTTPVTACTDCHARHDAAFMSKHLADYGPNCTSCHDGTDNMLEFDHSQVFALDGQHAALACNACHADQQFNTASAVCSACHEEPAIHKGVFGDKCGACHTTVAWSPAQLTQHTFPLDHGGQGEIACATCHSASYVDYTCFGCHEHEKADVRRTHARIDVTGERLADCAACHSTGRKTAADQ